MAHQEGIGVEEGVDEARVHLLPVVEEELRMRGGSVVAPTAASLLWTSVSVVWHGLVLISGGMIKICHCLNYIFSEYQSARRVSFHSEHSDETLDKTNLQIHCQKSGRISYPAL